MNGEMLRSWMDAPKNSPFPIQNLPYGVFRHPRGGDHVGVAIGEQILDLTVLEAEGVLQVPGPVTRPFAEGMLNGFLSLGKAAWTWTRETVQRLLRAEDSTIRDNSDLKSKVLVAQADVSMRLPVRVGDYTDFYSSREHATNVGTMLRGAENALMPNWLYLPVAYHGRASSVVVSGTPIRRPCGQSKPETSALPQFGPSRALDFELEMGAIVGTGNQLGSPISAEEAEGHVFGLVLVNDWSARDLQAWEYQPLGPFLSKNFATSISPWIVPLEALEPFRCAGPVQEPEPFPYLRQSGKTTFDIHLEVSLRTQKGKESTVLSKTNFRHLYWSLRQQLAHHTVNGCPLRPGDLLASGTISGPTPDSLGCLLELTWRGSRPVQLAGGETRRFLEDGDEVTMTGWCQGPGYRIGFGTVTGVIEPARLPETT